MIQPESNLSAPASVHSLSPPPASDAATLSQLPAGRYTAEVRDANGTSGVALVEMYDASISPALDQVQLVNLSTRTATGSGDAALVGGFVISSGAPVELLLRAIGPGLTQFDIPNPVSNPKISIFRQISGDPPTPQLIDANAQWGTHADLVTLASQSVGAFALDPGSADAAMVVHLEPGVYSIVAEGTSEAPRIILLEIYQIP